MSSINPPVIEDLLVASYLSSLAMNLDAQLRIDYDDCINKIAVDNPNEWATNYIEEGATFKLWPNNDRMLVAAETAQEIDNQCTRICPNDGVCNSKCDGCHVGLSFIFNSYAAYLDRIYVQIETKNDTRTAEKF